MTSTGEGPERQFVTGTETVYYESNDPNDSELVVFDGENYYRQSQRPSGPPLESFDPSDYTEIARLRRHTCGYGNYPWDHWFTWAIEDGVPEDLAQLGRCVIREADQHNWDRDLLIECGWGDSGAAMIQRALSDPEAARKRWDYLMEADGERVSPDE